MQLAAREILKVPLRGAKMNSFNKKIIGQAMGLMAISQALHGNMPSVFDFGCRPRSLPIEHPVKKCLLCGAEHQHNNAFCSADHCREYNRQRKENKESLPTALNKRVMPLVSKAGKRKTA
jgi:predicted nucleic acid-binding Zn ribbon protein